MCGVDGSFVFAASFRRHDNSIQIFVPLAYIIFAKWNNESFGGILFSNQRVFQGLQTSTVLCFIAGHQVFWLIQALRTAAELVFDVFNSKSFIG